MLAMYNKCAKRGAQQWMCDTHCEPTCLWEITSFVSVHPIGTKREPLCSWKSHSPGQCCIFPGRRCPAKPLTQWNQYSWILNTKHDLHHQHSTQPAPCSPCCLVLSLANLPLTGAFWKTGHFFFSMQAVRSVHPSNPQESDSEYLVKDGGRKVFTVLKNLGLVNAWENIASSALNFLIWLEASQTSHKTHLKLWAHARRGTASLFVSFSLGKIWPMVFCAAYTEWQAPTLLWCSH